MVQSATRGKQIVCSRCQLCYRFDRLIACLQSSVNQQGLLADKKREGRCSSDYFFFTVCVKHFSGFIEALDSKGICTLKKVLRQPHNVAGFTFAT